MLKKNPVVACRQGGFRQWLEHRDCGKICNASQLLQTLIILENIKLRIRRKIPKKLKDLVPCKNTKVCQPNRTEIDGKKETCDRKIIQKLVSILQI